MKLTISRSAALPAAFVATTARIFLDLALDSGPLHNGVWVAAILGALPAIPYLLCIDGAGTSAPKSPLRPALLAVLTAFTLTDAAHVLAMPVRAAGFLALESMNPALLTLPVALAVLWCLWRNGDAIGYAATLWLRVFPVLMAVVMLLQLRHYHPAWLCPLLGNGWRAIAREGARVSGWFVPATAVFFACDPKTEGRVKRPPMVKLALAAVVAALLLILRLMMTPTGISRMPWLARLDALLTNGRAPLYLQLPMLLTFFIGAMHLLTCECFAVSAMLQRLIPGLNGRLCGVITMVICALASSMRAMDAVIDALSPWLFVVASAMLALVTLTQKPMDGGERLCEG